MSDEGDRSSLAPAWHFGAPRGRHERLRLARTLGGAAGISALCLVSGVWLHGGRGPERPAVEAAPAVSLSVDRTVEQTPPTPAKPTATATPMPVKESPH